MEINIKRYFLWYTLRRFSDLVVSMSLVLDILTKQ